MKNELIKGRIFLDESNNEFIYQGCKHDIKSNEDLYYFVCGKIIKSFKIEDIKFYPKFPRVFGYVLGNRIAKSSVLIMENFNHAQFIKMSICPKTKQKFSHWHCFNKQSGMVTTLICHA